jgi:enoyl-CoA hydratase/carnithine racemase
MSLILTAHDGPITTLTFNRPDKHNSFDRAMLLELDDALVAASAREETRVVVLRGSPKAFSTGADLNEYRGYDPFQVRRSNLETWMRVFSRIEALDEPVVAAVQGHCIAGGTELTLACDLVVAAETATFGLVEARVGVIPGAGAAVRLPRWIGRAAAKELLMTGDTLSAEEAFRLGIVNRCVPAERFEEALAKLTGTLAQRSPLALAAVKRAVNVGGEMDIEKGMTYVLQEFALLFASNDQKEGMTAFLEKRPARFTGT